MYQNAHLLYLIARTKVHSVTRNARTYVTNATESAQLNFKKCRLFTRNPVFTSKARVLRTLNPAFLVNMSCTLIIPTTFITPVYHNNTIQRIVAPFNIYIYMHISILHHKPTLTPTRTQKLHLNLHIFTQAVIASNIY